MTSLLGAHVSAADPRAGALLRGADVVQLNLSAPRNWRAPKVRPDAAELKAWDVPVFVHAPYLVNFASINPEVRAKSRQCLLEQLAACEAIGAAGLVVHGGHPTGAGTLADGVKGWVEGLGGITSSVPVLIENTANGSAPVARRLEDLAVLWSALASTGANVGYCLDTCHAWAGGEPLDGLVERTLEVTGRVDLVHLNESRDAFDSRRDRHAGLGSGLIGLDALTSVVRDARDLAGAPSVLETPGDASEHSAELTLLRERLG
jgi:deoxyribonuclease-4